MSNPLILHALSLPFRVVVRGAPCYFAEVDTFCPSKVLEIRELEFEGVHGKVGPITFTLSPGENHVVYFDETRDGMAFARILKGMAFPLKGRVLKRGRDVTGWIVRDGIVVLIEGAFFSGTVGEELTFARNVGRAKASFDLDSLLAGIVERTGFCLEDLRLISDLTPYHRALLTLANALLMLPTCLVFLDPMNGFDNKQRVTYLELVSYGKSNLNYATLQVISRAHQPFFLEE